VVEAMVGRSSLVFPLVTPLLLLPQQLLHLVITKPKLKKRNRNRRIRRKMKRQSKMSRHGCHASSTGLKSG
jgi:hypothetical protein